MARLQSFRLFARLPTELRREIWEFAAFQAHRCVLEIYYRQTGRTWQAHDNSVCPDSIANICKEARAVYERAFGAYILIQHDIIITLDISFTLRGPQKSFLEAANSNRLSNIALTNDIWQLLRLTHHDFPTVTAAGVLREMKSLKTFTLAVTPGNEVALETESNGYGDPWTEDIALLWIEDWTDEDGPETYYTAEPDWAGPNRYELAETYLEDESYPRAYDDANIDANDKADRFLAGLEAVRMRGIRESQEKALYRMEGSICLTPFQDNMAFSEDNAEDFYQNIRDMIGRERVMHPEWKPPMILVRGLTQGEMFYNDKYLGQPGYDPLDIGGEEDDQEEEESAEENDDGDLGEDGDDYSQDEPDDEA